MWKTALTVMPASSRASAGAWTGYGLAIGVQEKRGYKARPLHGIWATPPFLHNGSVPNLFQLLSPVVERDTLIFTLVDKENKINNHLIIGNLNKYANWEGGIFIRALIIVTM